ncbi:MAG: ABC transporter substrate-binding protein [Finegoldia magna]|nr:ABC transporter substrate-binding protein [Finegoldia magna]MBS5942789.1 ABC transporter substrate-binding protein [Finegoldia magna]
MKSKLSLLLAIIICITAFSGCSNNGNDAGDKETLTVATSGDAISLDPVSTNDNQSSNVMSQIYEGLVEIGEDNKPKPLLAEKIDQKDDVTYTIHLKKNVKFHNGEEMKANDVVFSLKRAVDAPNVKHLFNSIDKENVKAIDDYTVEMKLKEPYAGIIYSLCHPGAFICNEKAVKEGGDNYKMNPVGTGSVKFVSWTKADSVVMERFDDYHGEKTQYKTLKFRVIPEPTNRLVELESGGVDISYDIAPNDISKVTENTNLKLVRGQDYGTTYLGFNCQKKPFDNPKVREAISYAVDMEGIIKAVFLGIGKTATSPMPQTLKFSVADQIKPKTRDVNKAKQLLKEAGFEKGFKTSLSTNEKKERIDMATAIKEQLAEVGIDCSINVLEWSAFNDLLKNGKQDMFEIAWIADTPDPDSFMFPCFHSSAAGEGGNYCYLKDQEMDKLLEDAKKENDEAKRAELYKKAQQHAIDISAWVPEYNGELLVGHKKEIQNFKVSPFGWYKLQLVKKAE